MAGRLLGTGLKAVVSLATSRGLGIPSLGNLRAHYGPSQPSLLVAASTIGNLNHVKALIHHGVGKEELVAGLFKAAENG